MTGKRLVKRVATIMAMTVGIFVLLAVMRAEATPIRPDIRKVLAEPQPSPNQFAPARAGWYGSEMPRTPQVVNTTYEQLSPQATARIVRNSLIAASLPDYRALAAIALVILLLRRIRKTRREMLASSAVSAQPPARMPVAARAQQSAAEVERVA